MSQYILTFLLFFLPLLVLPFGATPYEVPKVLVAEALIEILIVAALIKGLLPRRIPLWIIIIFGLSFFHLTLLRDNFIFFGNSHRLQGIFLLWHLTALALLVKQVKLKNTFWYAFVSLVMLLVSALLILSEAGRVIGTMGEPNALGAAVIFLWPFVALDTANFKGKELFKISVILMVLVSIMLSGSRSALVAFLVQMIFLGIINRNLLPLRKAVLISFVLVVASMTLPFLENAGPLEDRVELWQTAWSAGWERPIFGGGFGNVETRLSQTSWRLTNSLRFQNVDSSHNVLLDWWAQGGVIGLGLIIYIISKTANSFIQSGNIIDLLRN